MPTIEACLRTFDHYGNRDNKIRARMKWLVDTMGIDELRERIIKERKFLRAARDWPGGIPEQVQRRRRRARRQRHAGQRDGRSAPASAGQRPGAAARRPTRSSGGTKPTSCAASTRGTVSAYAYSQLGDITTEQFRRLADIQRDFALDIRITNRQNFALRDLTEADLRAALRPARRDRAWPSPAPSSPATSSPAPAPTRATSRSRSRAASPPRSATRSRTPASPRSAACASTSRAARTAAASTTSPTSGSWASSAARTAGPRPATRCCSAATSATMEVEFGDKAGKLPAKTAPEAVVRIVGRFAGEREAGETFTDWLARSGGAKGVGDVGEGSRPLPHSRRRRPTSTSTTTRPALRRRSRRRRVRGDVTATTDDDAQRHRRLAAARRRRPRRARRGLGRARAQAGERPRSSGRTSASAPASCSPRRSRTACSSTSR